MTFSKYSSTRHTSKPPKYQPLSSNPPKPKFRQKLSLPAGAVGLWVALQSRSVPPGGRRMEEDSPRALGHPGPYGAPEAWAARCRERLLFPKATSVASPLYYGTTCCFFKRAGMAEAPGARPLQPRLFINHPVLCYFTRSFTARMFFKEGSSRHNHLCFLNI